VVSPIIEIIEQKGFEIKIKTPGPNVDVVRVRAAI